ncbi:MAG: GNAT family N-acetyltransferase, partial [Chloroflexota bacterium]
MTPTFDYATFPVLRTRRLLLREIVPSDTPEMFRIRGDIRVTRLNSGRPMETSDEARDLIEKSRQAFLDHRRIDWGITLKEPQTGL